MSTLELILDRMEGYSEKPAIYWKGGQYSYGQFLTMIRSWDNRLEQNHVESGEVCAIFGDYSPQVCALIFALIKRNAIIVPFTRAIAPEIPRFKEIAEVESQFSFDEEDSWKFERYHVTCRNKLILDFKRTSDPGLIVFSSGSTGEPKGVLQNCEKVLQKFISLRKGWKTVLFLMMDHFGGFNTLLSSFSYGGMAVCLPDRSADTVCSVIQSSKADLLPTTPTFLNLLIASGCYKKYNLDSIELITYGTEMMNETTLKSLKILFPNATLKQTYGLSELGVLRSKSEKDDSVWMKIGGDEFQLKIKDNILWIKADSNMVGYLNAPDPFDEDGWFCTGDEVEVRDGYMRFLGRKSEVINVGGQKVYPADVEAVLLEDDNVKEATVYGKAHPLMGQVVMARVSLKEEEDKTALSARLRNLCIQKIARYKIPMSFEIISGEEQHNARFKKVRKIED